MSGNTKTSVADQCPVCGDEYDAVEYGSPASWAPAGQVGAKTICEDFARQMRVYHGVDADTADEFGLTLATSVGLVDEVLRYEGRGPLTVDDTESVCPFEAAGWMHEEAERILSINRRETEMRFRGDSPDAL